MVDIAFESSDILGRNIVGIDMNTEVPASL
jgi:hypothetical protein